MAVLRCIEPVSTDSVVLGQYTTVGAGCKKHATPRHLPRLEPSCTELNDILCRLSSVTLKRHATSMTFIELNEYMLRPVLSQMTSCDAASVFHLGPWAPGEHGQPGYIDDPTVPAGSMAPTFAMCVMAGGVFRSITQPDVEQRADSARLYEHSP